MRCLSFSAVAQEASRGPCSTHGLQNPEKERRSELADLDCSGALGRHGAQRAAMSNLTRRHNITPIRGLP